VARSPPGDEARLFIAEQSTGRIVSRGPRQQVGPPAITSPAVRLRRTRSPAAVQISSCTCARRLGRAVRNCAHGERDHAREALPAARAALAAVAIVWLAALRTVSAGSGHDERASP
jgi:hypothetical protein